MRNFNGLLLADLKACYIFFPDKLLTICAKATLLKSFNLLVINLKEQDPDVVKQTCKYGMTFTLSRYLLESN